MPLSLFIAEVAVTNSIRNSLSDDISDFKVAPIYKCKGFYLIVSIFHMCTFFHSYHYFLNTPSCCSSLTYFYSVNL